MRIDRPNEVETPGRRWRLAVLAVLAIVGVMAVIAAIADSRANDDKKSADKQPSANRSNKPTQPAAAGSADAPPAAAPSGEHPIDASLAIAHRVQEHLQKDVKDYTCIFVKTERVNGELIGPQQIDAKIRQKPFGVYFKFLKPDDVKGREVIYNPGQNGGKLVAREG
ncbi:MAG TPA: DUF1571 domain-containing protein, partial [Pirellulales bacterium]|nr:DUF1571 domain-containing protein [Pirellulales bacterium]